MHDTLHAHIHLSLSEIALLSLFTVLLSILGSYALALTLRALVPLPLLVRLGHALHSFFLPLSRLPSRLLRFLLRLALAPFHLALAIGLWVARVVASCCLYPILGLFDEAEASGTSDDDSPPNADAPALPPTPPPSPSSPPPDATVVHVDPSLSAPYFDPLRQQLDALPTALADKLDSLLNERDSALADLAFVRNHLHNDIDEIQDEFHSLAIAYSDALAERDVLAKHLEDTIAQRDTALRLLAHPTLQALLPLLAHRHNDTP